MLIKIKFRFPEIVIGILLTVAIFAMGMVYESSRHQPSNTQASSVAGQIQTAHQPESFSWDWMTHDGAVFFTFVLSCIAVIQAGLFVWQLRYMRKGMRDATIAANASDLSAKAAIGIQLPIIRIVPDKIISRDTRDGDEIISSRSVGRLNIINRGRSEASPVETKTGMYYGNRLPDNPEYFRHVDLFPIETIIEANPETKTFQNLVRCTILLPDGANDEIYIGNVGLWFYCCLVYYDFMQTRHEDGFCWRWQNVGMGMDWRSDRTPSYNRKLVIYPPRE